MNLLIVDDEVITIKGMMNGIDWKACGIDGKIWTAYSAESALKVLKAQEIRLMLYDVECPGITASIFFGACGGSIRRLPAFF